MSYSGSSAMFITNNPINIQAFSKRPFKENGRGYSKLNENITPAGGPITLKINPKTYRP